MLRLLLVTLCLHLANGDYEFTISQKWVSGGDNQVCLSTKEVLDPNYSLTINVYRYYSSPPRISFEYQEIVPYDAKDRELLSEFKNLTFDEYMTYSCVKIAVQPTTDRYGDVEIIGSVNGNTVNQTSEIRFMQNIPRTFIETARPKYRPGDTVQFRVVSLDELTLAVNYSRYLRIELISPSSTAIAQWSYVSNTNGLVQRDFTLIDKPEIGNYTISVLQSLYQPYFSTTFEVVDYDFPQFKVKISQPKSVLATEPSLMIRVCATYNFGAQLKGQLVGSADNGGRFGAGVYELTELNFNDTIHGCKNLNINLTKLEINSYDSIAEKVNIKLQVLEEGTENIVEKRITIPISRVPIKMENTRLFHYRKPGIPYAMRIFVTNNDETPASLEPISVCAGGKCANVTTDSEGYLKFSLPPHMQYQRLKLTALNHPKLEVTNPSGDSMQLYMHAPVYHFYPEDYYSPSNSSLQILPSSFQEIKCRADKRKVESLRIKIIYAVPTIIETNLNVMLISRGKIRYSEVIPVVYDAKDLPSDINLLFPMEASSSGESGYRGSWEISLDVLYNMSPEFKILIWYTSPEGEIVADSYNMKMEECLNNKVKMSWSNAKPRRGEPTTVSVEAEPDSFCSIGIEDVNVEETSTSLFSRIMKRVHDLQPDSVTANQVNDYEFCKEKLRGDKDTLRNYVSDYVDATKMFDNAGILIMSDSIYATRPCKVTTSHNGGQSKPKDGFYEESQIVFFGRDVSDDNPGFNSLFKYKQEETYDYSSETFLWELFSVDANGQYTKELKFSDAIPEYRGKIVCTHPERGVGISDSTLITPFNPFYVEAKGSPSLRLGEHMVLTITVYNNDTTILPIKLMMDTSDRLEIVKSDGKVVVDQSEASTQVLQVPANGRAVWTLEIKPKRAMNVLMNITAEVDSSYANNENKYYAPQSVLKSVSVVHEGFPKEIVQSSYICGKGAEITNDATFKMEIPESYQVTPNSVETWVTVDGELMRPTINNIENVLQIPTGVGEPTVLQFTSAIYAYEYLIWNRKSGNKKKMSLLVDKAYQSLLKFRNPDGAFSQFMNSSRYSEKSSWLTAYAVKAMTRAREITLNDDKLFKHMIRWLKETQIEEDVLETNATLNLRGCYKIFGKPVHNGFKGGLSDSETVILTSYVVAALMEAGERTFFIGIANALTCINRAPESDHPYALALKAYALVLAKNETAEQAVQNLLSTAVNTSETTYWKISDDASSTFEIETAGYAILAMLNQDDKRYFDTATKVMKWMTTRRSSRGGFLSSQDTNVALESFLLYEKVRKKLFKIRGNDLRVYISNNVNEEVFKIDNRNKYQTGKMQNDVTLPSELKIRSNGTGCATVQAVIKFNQEKAEPSDSFSFNIYSTEGKKENSKTLTICARYLASNVSNLVVMDVNLMSGFVPKKSALKELYQYGLISHYEVNDGRVVFYFDEMSQDDPNCVELEITKETEVVNMKNGTVAIFDYYRPQFYSYGEIHLES